MGNVSLTEYPMSGQQRLGQLLKSDKTRMGRRRLLTGLLSLSAIAALMPALRRQRRVQVQGWILLDSDF